MTTILLKKSSLLIGILCLTMPLVQIDAHADPVTWTLDNAVFDDDGTATGSFVYDRDTNTYSDVSITTSPAYPSCGYEYTV